MTAWIRIAAIGALLAGTAEAQTRPVPRPDTPGPEVMSATPRPPSDVAAVPTSPRPPFRVDPDAAAARSRDALLAAPAPVIAADGTVRVSDRPAPRPDVRRPVSAVQGRGLCGRPSLDGEAIAPVRGQGACGIPRAVRVRAVGGVPLSNPVRMDCRAAEALDDWVRDGVIPLVNGRGGGVAQLDVAAGYSCRPRNNQAGARLSEHSFGRAIDISGIRLVNGEVLSVLQDWARGPDGRLLERLWSAACGPFTTVLGPNSDRFHRDHFHFDVASDRRRAYCR